MTEKLAIFLPSLAGGGAERVALTLANGFSRRGHEVHLLLGEATGPFLDEVSPKVRIFDFARRGVMSCVPRLAIYLRRERPASLLSLMSHTNVAALCAHRLARSNARLVLSERLSYRAFKNHHRDLKHQVLRLLMRLTYRHADAIIVVAEAMKRELVEGLDVNFEHLHAIPNPVITAQIGARIEAARAAIAPRGAAGAPIILGAGRLHTQKDFETLLRAFAILRATRPCRLVVLGEGDRRGQLEALAVQLGIAKDVEMPGFVISPFEAMTAADLFVLSSRYEGSPGVLIQAMACGTQVVSTNCPTGPEEILEGGRWGKIVPVGDSQALAAAMSETLDGTSKVDVRRRAMDFGEEPSIDKYLAVMLKKST